MSKRDKVLEILSGVVARPVAELSPELDLVGDLDVDSAQVMELLAEVEDAFGVEISEVEATKLRTVADVLAFLERSEGA